uniref:Uncharacterized protein n=1 Tax=Nicotiana tabacum TaxID=4097 RepID=A0A1S3XNS1_TOBAC|nr:PREDICTED: uncharacterized protein LOC107767105 [Nicotiana tabacum]
MEQFLDFLFPYLWYVRQCGGFQFELFGYVYCSWDCNTRKRRVICKYKSDPTVALGYLSFALLVASSVADFLSLFYPYQGKSIPQAALLKNTSFVVVLNIALGTTGLAAALILWPTISEQLHITRNIHHNLQTDCPTTKTGLLGGGAFLSLDSALFWLVALMLADNAREDYFQDADVKGELKASYADDEVIKSSA